MVKDYNEKITWINTNCVPALNTWTAVDAVYTAGTGFVISAGGSITCSYTDEGKKAARFRRYTINFDSTNITQINNYQNDIFLDEYALCKDINNEYTQVENCVPILIKGSSTISNSELQIVLDRACLNQDIETSEIIIINNSSNSVTIKGVSVLRSNDVTGQAGDIINNYIIDDPGGEIPGEDPGGIIINNDDKLIYLVPVMTLAEWNASSKEDFNEAIIVG